MDTKKLGTGLFGAMALIHGNVFASEPWSLPSVDLDRITLCGDGSLQLSDDALLDEVMSTKVTVKRVSDSSNGVGCSCSNG